MYSTPLPRLPNIYFQSLKMPTVSSSAINLLLVQLPCCRRTSPPSPPVAVMDRLRKPRLEIQPEGKIHDDRGWASLISGFTRYSLFLQLVGVTSSYFCVSRSLESMYHFDDDLQDPFRRWGALSELKQRHFLDPERGGPPA